MNLVVGIMLWSRNTFQMDKPKLSMQTMPLKSLTFTLFVGKRPQSIPTLSTSPPKFPLKKIREEAKSIKTCPSAPHTVKGFADDITIISPSVPAHNYALKETDKKASSLDLRLKPEKCIPFLLMERILAKSPLSCSPMVPLEISQKVLGHLLSSLSNLLLQSISQEARRETVFCYQKH